jgi:hypothetical protein
LNWRPRLTATTPEPTRIAAMATRKTRTSTGPRNRTNPAESNGDTLC